MASEARSKTCESRSSGKWTLLDFEAYLRRMGITPAFEVVHDHRGEHWLWKGRKTNTGYAAVLHPSGVWLYLHRLSVEATDGQIPRGKQVRHRCQHRSCCTRWHLLLGSAAENARDKREAVR